MKTKAYRACTLFAALAVLPVTFVRSATNQSVPKTEAALAEIRGDAAKTALKELDLEMDRVDALLDNAPSQADRVAAKARLAVLKERRSDLRKTYVKARYDELRADLRIETERVSAWAKRKFSSDPATKATDEMNATVKEAKAAARAAEHKAYAEASTADAATDIAIYKLRPTDTNKEEAKAGLKALEVNIDALAKRIDRLPDSEERTTAMQRLKLLKERRAALQSDFNKARFDALVDDVKHAWDETVY
jgi:chromosome segregation ATPase